MPYTIVFDAGHGGSDPGAVYEGRREKDDNLSLAIAVGLLLNGRIALDTCAQRAIVTEREEEMGNACFGGDMLLGK